MSVEDKILTNTGDTTMKGILRLIALLTVLALVFTGCSVLKFDLDKSVTKLKENGFIESASYITNRELADLTEYVNANIRYMDGDFTAEIKNYQSYIELEDNTKGVEFITFATEEQASAYVEMFIAYRQYDYEGITDGRITSSGCVLVMTNSELAERLLYQLKFQ